MYASQSNTSISSKEPFFYVARQAHSLTAVVLCLRIYVSLRLAFRRTNGGLEMGRQTRQAVLVFFPPYIYMYKCYVRASWTRLFKTKFRRFFWWPFFFFCDDDSQKLLKTRPRRVLPRPVSGEGARAPVG